MALESLSLISGLVPPSEASIGRLIWVGALRDCHPQMYLSPESIRRATARLQQPEPRMRLAVRGVPKGALRTHSA